MSRISINRIADEFGVNHWTAGLIAETCESIDELRQRLEMFAKGEGFALID